MNAQQRTKHLAKVHSLAVTDHEVHKSTPELAGASATTLPQTHLTSEGHTASQSSLSVDVLSAAQGMTVPLTCREGIWRKASELLRDPSAMAEAPGQSSEARMVLSHSGGAPHLVTPVKGGGYSCDSSCPNWKSISFCSHTVAVAERNGQLRDFVQFLQKKKKIPNLTNLITANMPHGRGRKGGHPPRTRKRSSPDSETRLSMHIGAGSQVDAAGGSAISTFAPITMMQMPYSSGVPPGYFPYPGTYLPNPCQPPGPGLFPAHAPTPFTLCFIKGNISTCFGCHNKYTNKQPPNDLCIRHQEWRQYTPQGSDLPQAKFTNAYYHCKPECVWLRHPDFVPAYVEVPNEVQEHLSQSHKDHLASVLGVYLS